MATAPGAGNAWVLREFLRFTVAARNVEMPKPLIPLTKRKDNDSDRQVHVDGATVDVGRQQRCGFAEVIYGEGKPVTLIGDIIEAQQSAGQDSLVTRIDESAAAQLANQFGFSVHCRAGRTLRVGAKPISKSESISHATSSPPRHVAVVTAGSTDAPRFGRSDGNAFVDEHSVSCLYRHRRRWSTTITRRRATTASSVRSHRHRRYGKVLCRRQWVAIWRCRSLRCPQVLVMARA